MINRIIIRTSLVKNRCTVHIFIFALITPGRSENLTIEGYQITRHRHF